MKVFCLDGWHMCLLNCSQVNGSSGFHDRWTPTATPIDSNLLCNPHEREPPNKDTDTNCGKPPGRAFS